MTSKIYTITAAFDAAELKKQNVLGKKIAESRVSSGMSQKELAGKLASYNISISPASISKWEKGAALPNPYQLLALSHIFGINDMLEYFTGCSPEPQDYTPELSQKGLNLLQMFKEMLIASGKYAPHTRRSMPATVPVKVFLTPAAAGSGSFLNGEDYEMIDFNPNNVPEGTDFGIRVSGDSMLPRYVSGQIVFVEQCKELYPGEIGVFVHNGNAYIKQYQETMQKDTYPKITLFSLNRDLADCDVHVKPDDDLFIVGRVLS
ncbi:helix-turn-helix domain-containing protein [Anaerostipes caccae]|uniref:helix-turn-helix domain-containing protein n=1 Tax=Anaerostipes caccae TaxID=105841 RepID=UPI003993384F